MMHSLLIALALTMTILPGSWLFYTLTVQHGAQVQIYYYNFTVISITPNAISFNLTVTFPNGTSVTKTLSVPSQRPFPFPINGSAFCLSNITYIGSKGNVSIYRGIFKVDNVSVPVTAYYVNGVLSNYTGTSDGFRVVAALEAEYFPTATPGPIKDFGAWLIIAVLIGAIAIGAIVLIRIGKI